MAQIEKRDITRVSINLPTPMVKKVKEYALELGLPITQSYTVLINMGLEQKQLYNSLPELIKSANTLKDIYDNSESAFTNSEEEKKQ